MGKDYYSILGVARTAPENVIRTAYGKQALKYHPDKNQSAGAAERFKDAAEAFEVLSDMKRRDIFDVGGEEALKGPFQYEFHGDPLATFAQFFGTTSPFDGFFETLIFSGPGDDHMPDGAPGGCSARTDPPIEHDVFVSLEEVFTGCVKHMKVTRKVEGRLGECGREEKTFEINVRPGWKAGTKVTFPREGDRRFGRIPADIVFVIRDQPHRHFERDGEHLVYTARVSLKQALCGFQMSIPPLHEADAPLLLVEHQVLHPNATRRFSSAGLPYIKEPKRRGDLVVHFEIQFPIALTPEQIATLQMLL